MFELYFTCFLRIEQALHYAVFWDRVRPWVAAGRAAGWWAPHPGVYHRRTDQGYPPVPFLPATHWAPNLPIRNTRNNREMLFFFKSWCLPFATCKHVNSVFFLYYLNDLCNTLPWTLVGSSFILIILPLKSKIEFFLGSPGIPKINLKKTSWLIDLASNVHRIYASTQRVEVQNNTST